MSEETMEKVDRVVLSEQDVKAINDFWTHFKCEMPPELTAALDKFSQERTVQNQEMVKMYLLGAMINNEHEVFKDDVFTKILAQCSKVVYSMTFDRDLEKQLVDESKK